MYVKITTFGDVLYVYVFIIIELTLNTGKKKGKNLVNLFLLLDVTIFSFCKGKSYYQSMYEVFEDYSIVFSV